jgi:hypothetical protein
MSLVLMHEAACIFHARVRCDSSIVHSRSLPCRGLCLARLRQPAGTQSGLGERVLWLPAMSLYMRGLELAQGEILMSSSAGVADIPLHLRSIR